MNTPATKVSELEHNWQLVDVKGKVLGRVASEIAQKLIGKAKTNYVRSLDCGDNVVVINAAHFIVTGKKDKEKLYGNFSGFPGGRKKKALWQVRQEKPTEPIRHAVWGMLPKNKLRDRLITRLYIYPTAEHPYTDKFSK